MQNCINGPKEYITWSAWSLDKKLKWLGVATKSTLTESQKFAGNRNQTPSASTNDSQQTASHFQNPPSQTEPPNKTYPIYNPN